MSSDSAEHYFRRSDIQILNILTLVLPVASPQTVTQLECLKIEISCAVSHSRCRLITIDTFHITRLEACWGQSTHTGPQLLV